MAQFKVVVNVTDKHGNPLIGMEVELVDTGAFTPANHDPIEHVVAIETTDISGTAAFTGLTPSMYYARPRITRPDIRIQMMSPSGIGNLCYSAIVDPNGRGTHTTIQSAIDDLGTAGGTVLICAGTYQENLTIAGDTEDLWLIGISRNCVTIQGTAASPTITVDAAGTGAVENFRLEHLTIDHTGAQTLLYFNSVAGGIPTKVNLLDLLFVSGAIGIDMSDINGGTRFTLRDIVMESAVTDAGQLQVSDLTISDCKIYCGGVGLYVGGASAATGIRMVNSEFRGSSDCALRIRNTNDAQITNCRLVATGAATKGLRVSSTNDDTTISNCVLDIADGIGIDIEFAGALLVIDGCSLACGGQVAPREGIVINGNHNEVAISDCHIKNFDSYGIKLETIVAANGQHFILDGVDIQNGGDTHSIYLGGWDYGTVTGCVLVGTGGENTTYGIYGAAGTTYTVIVGNVEQDHDGMTNLTNGVDGNTVGSNTGSSGNGMGPSPHDPVTLDANADALLSLDVQELGLDTQLANLVFAGPDDGEAAVPTFRALVDADIPAAIMRDQEHTDIGDDAPHHARYENTEAVAAVEAADPLVLAGDVTIAAGKSLSVDTIVEITADAGVTVEGVKSLDSFLEFMEIAKPANPAENKLRLYTKDKAGVSTLYYLQDDGTEVEVGAGGGGGATDHIVDADSDTEVHVEKNADEDKVRMKVAGTERLVLQNTSPHLTLTGNLQLSGVLGIVGTAPDATIGINMTSAVTGSFTGFQLSPAILMTTSSREGYGVAGIAQARAYDGTVGHIMRGLSFEARGVSIASTATFAELTGAYVDCGIMAVTSGTLTITKSRGLVVGGGFGYPTGSASIVTTDHRQIDVALCALPNMVDCYGIRVADQTQASNNNYIAWFGDATPQLRVDGGAYAVANKSAVVLNMNGTLYRIIRNAGTGALETEAA